MYYCPTCKIMTGGIEMGIGFIGPCMHRVWNLDSLKEQDKALQVVQELGDTIFKYEQAIRQVRDLNDQKEEHGRHTNAFREERRVRIETSARLEDATNRIAQIDEQNRQLRESVAQLTSTIQRMASLIPLPEQKPEQVRAQRDINI